MEGVRTWATVISSIYVVGSYESKYLESKLFIPVLFYTDTFLCCCYIAEGPGTGHTL